MKMQELFVVRDWCSTHKAEITRQTRSQVCRSCQADTGIKVGVTTIAEIEESLGITRLRGNGQENGARKDRCVVIARELIRVMESLGVTPADDLRDVSTYK